MYSSPRFISEPISNNRLNFHERGKQEIYVPSLIEWTMDDVKLWEQTVIEGEVEGKIIAGIWLEHLIFLKDARVPTWIMDNHNHAFAFWHDALAKWYIQMWSLLVHIDQHTDLATPLALPIQNAKFKVQNNGLLKNSDKAPLSRGVAWNAGGFESDNPPIEVWIIPPLDRGALGEKVWTFSNLEEVEEYTNTILTIADFIIPAMANGLIAEALMVTGEDRFWAGFFGWEHNERVRKGAQITTLGKRTLIVDLDLDYFAQGYDERETSATVRYWLAKADIITIATSPLFIDQEKALHILKSLQKDLLDL